MHVHIVQHESFEALGALAYWIENRHHTVSYSKVYACQPLPESVEAIDLLVVMGGPQSADTTPEACPYFDAEGEMALIRRCKEAGKRVLGVCLGAQLIGQALGAPYEHSPQKEVGVFPIYFTDAGRDDPFLHRGFHGLPVGHWHNDMPGLTPEARVLAVSDGCPRQIIRYSDRVYGFQCHMEFTSELVERFLDLEASHWPEAGTYPYVQTPEAFRREDFGAMNEALCEFLDAFTGWQP